MVQHETSDLQEPKQKNMLRFPEFFTSNVSLFLGILANPSYQKTAIRVSPEAREGNVHTSHESARGWSLCEADVKLRNQGVPHEGPDTERTLRHCERLFGTNVTVLVLAINATTASRHPNLLKWTPTKNIFIERVPD